MSFTDSSLMPSEKVIESLESNENGLKENEALARQKKYGLNLIHKRKINILSILFRQISGNPLIIILTIATAVSYFLGQNISSYYIFGMIILSIFLGLWNDYGAERTIDNLLKRISKTTIVFRNGEKREINASEITIGDIILLTEGSIVPADLRIISSSNLQINESALTGEAKTVFKIAEKLSEKTQNISEQSNIAFMGTSIDSGSGKAIVIRVGKDTEFGKIAKSAIYIKPSTDFERGLSRFGQLLIKVIFTLTIAILGINYLIGRPFLDSLLFALAIAVGLTPELLPVIVTVSLSHGAGKLAKKKVIAKQLIAIENLGNMDVLCTDKTGTLTEGDIKLVNYLNTKDTQDENVLLCSLYCNTALIHNHVVGNGIDAAIWKYAIKNKFPQNLKIKKIQEDPFDYEKKAMFTIISDNNDLQLIAKGSPKAIFTLCKNKEINKSLEEKFSALSNDGLRIVVVAKKKIEKKDSYTWKDANNLSIVGYLTFLDTPKLSVKEALLQLKTLNVDVKIITGDNELVTKKICKEVGITIQNILFGEDILKFSDDELKSRVNETNIFARVSPEQKMQIIQALKSNGHTVGFLGDGINDIPALRNADVGISVNTAVDVAKDAAAIVLIHKSLNVITEGIIEGRKTFNNTIKYILMGTSSNFGNMFSAAGASFFLPFLPMTPVQILLNNALYDISQLSIPSDNVDSESLVKPRHWNIDFIRNYMIFFGPISSLYDFLTFGVMFYLFKAQGGLFQAGWFIESMATQILVVFVIRTSRRPFFLSKPSKWLLITCVGIVGIAILIPFSPLAPQLGFITPPPLYFAVLIILVSTYLLLVELLKRIFLKKFAL